jgi:S1-C subfamily serine protease
MEATDSNKQILNTKAVVVTVITIAAVLWIGSLLVTIKFFSKLPQVSSQSNKSFENQRVVDEESVVIDVVQKVSPSVVSIAVENTSTIDFFGLPQNSKKQESGIGSGFVVSKDGLIMTNKHVVSQEGEKYIAIIRANDGTEKKYPVKEINRDPFNDMAIVKVDAGDLTPIELGDSDHIKVGQRVIAIGNALGQFENTVTTGVVSGLSRGVSPVDPLTGAAEKLEDLIQTDAAINPGNSGGPLVNSSGQVIGINTAVASANNIGFALKINVAKQLLSDFNSSGGKISRPFFGVRYTHISKDVALLNNVPQGELVREVVASSSADKAGIKTSDIITEFDSQKMIDESTLTKIIRAKKVGDVVKVRIFRDEKTLDLTVTLGEAPNQ